MKKHRRIDRFVESAIDEFARWIRGSTWLGKERDCVNLFAARFVRPVIAPHSAVTDYSQVRIECGVPQPAHRRYSRPSAATDLVTWHGPLGLEANPHSLGRHRVEDPPQWPLQLHV